MREKAKAYLSRPWVIGLLVVVFILLNMVAIQLQRPIFNVLPVAILGGYLLIYFPKPLLVFLIFITPLSFNFEDIGSFGGIGFYFPTEPMLFGLMLLFVVKLLIGYRLDKNLLRHPLTISILFSLVWIGITTLTSSMPVVSFKFLLSRLWFVLVLYFMINQFFKDEKFIRKFLLAFIAGMTIAIIYTVQMHAINSFSEEAAHWVMWPFFKDHTSYGAIIALCFPFVVFFFLRAKKLTLEQLIWGSVLVVFTVGLILSYTRAAWVSLVGALGVWMLIKLRIDFKVVLAGVLVLGGFYLGFEDQIVRKLESNRQDSSDSIMEHIQSITNISSDASNLERLNRWNSALRMFEDEPVFGHGPGTYMFKYGTYQKHSDATIISTNQGDGGNAHSEYLGPLSEQGLFGALSILAMFLISIYTGVKLYYQMDHNPYLKGVVMCIIMGLVTYYLHGILNNFLDTDKASVPIWGLMSMLVAIKLYHGKSSLKEAAAD